MLGKTNRGFESLPVRPYYVPQSRDFEELRGQGVSPPRGEKRMARGQVQGGAIPTAINIWIIGPIPPCPTLLRPAVAGLRRAGRTEIFSHAKSAKAGTGDEGIRDSGVKGGPIPPCAVTAKANLPRRWVFRLIAEAGINNAVALQRQPYLGVGCFD